MPCSYQRPADGWHQADETSRLTVGLVHQLVEEHKQNLSIAKICVYLRGQGYAERYSPFTTQLPTSAQGQICRYTPASSLSLSRENA